MITCTLRKLLTLFSDTEDRSTHEFPGRQAHGSGRPVDEGRLPAHDDFCLESLVSRSRPCHCCTCPPCSPAPSSPWPSGSTAAAADACPNCCSASCSPAAAAPSPPGSEPPASPTSSVLPTAPSAPSAAGPTPWPAARCGPS